MFEFGRELRRLFGVADPVSGQGWSHRRRRRPARAARPAECCAPRPRAPTSPPAASAPATAPVVSWKPPSSGAKSRAAPATPPRCARRPPAAERAAEQLRRAAIASRAGPAPGSNRRAAPCWAPSSSATPGLEAAAETAAAEAQRAGGAAGMLALAVLAQIHARRSIAAGGAAEARAAARLFNDPIGMLESAGRRDAHLKLAGLRGAAGPLRPADRRGPAAEGRGPDPRRRSATSPPPRSGWTRPTSR